MNPLRLICPRHGFLLLASITLGPTGRRGGPLQGSLYSAIFTTMSLKGTETEAFRFQGILEMAEFSFRGWARRHDGNTIDFIKRPGEVQELRSHLHQKPASMGHGWHAISDRPQAQFHFKIMAVGVLEATLLCWF